MGAPKATCRLDGRRFVDWLIESLSAIQCEPLLVVTGAARFEVPSPAQAIHHPDWRRGPLSSLQRGILAFPPGISGVLQCTVDRPRVAVSTLRALCKAHRDQPGALWQPRADGRSGHPLLWPRCLFSHLLDLDSSDPKTSARTLIGSPDVTVTRRYVDVQDPAIHENLDRPGDLPGSSRH